MGNEWRRERRLARPRRDDIRDELLFHLEERVEEYRAAGLDEAAARRKAREVFGDLERAARECAAAADTRRPISWRGWDSMEAFGHDVRYAVRALVRRPGYSGAVLLTLILGIGAPTAVFSVVNGVLLHPLPHPDPDQLALIYEVDQRPGYLDDHNVVAAANYRDWRELNRTFAGMAAYQVYPITYRGIAGPERVQMGRVTGDFFSLLGVTAALGRTFLPDEDKPGSPAVVVLGHSFWQTVFGGDSAAVGSSITVGSSQAEIVGVLPAGFRFLDEEHPVWTPLTLGEQQFGNRMSHSLRVMGRVRSGSDLAAAQADLDRVVAGLRDQYPEHLTGWGVNVVSMSEEVVGRFRPALLVLLGAVGLVLLIAAVNVANLMLARTIAESRELAIRSSLGAGRGMLIRSKLAESGVLAAAGGLLGLAAAIGGIRLLPMVGPVSLPQHEYIGVDWRVLGFAGLASLVSAAVFTVAPALLAARTGIAGVLKDGGRSATGSRGHQRLRSVFVVTQLAFSTMLLVSAGLMLSSFARLMRVDPGFEPAGVATLRLGLSGVGGTGAGDLGPMHDRLLAAVRALPEVELAGVTRFLPMDEPGWTWSVQVQGAPEPEEGEKRDYDYHTVDPEYFRAMGITLIRGRQFAETDGPDAPRVVIVDQAFVNRFFPGGEDPLGRHMHLIARPDESLEIVGVVESVYGVSLDREPQPAYYVPYRQVPFAFFLAEMSLVVRTQANPETIIPALRRVLRSVHPDVVISNVTTMRDRVARSVARTRFAMMLLTAFAGVALALAAVGVYGVIAYAVGLRRQEIGVRLALGAQPARIVTQFVRSGLALTGTGVATGLLGAGALARFQASLLFGVAPWDPATYATVALLLVAVATLAIYLPSRRASVVEPIAVLRED